MVMEVGVEETPNPVMMTTLQVPEAARARPTLPHGLRRHHHLHRRHHHPHLRRPHLLTAIAMDT